MLLATACRTLRELISGMFANTWQAVVAPCTDGVDRDAGQLPDLSISPALLLEVQYSANV
jgi:hypothetical protein